MPPRKPKSRPSDRLQKATDTESKNMREVDNYTHDDQKRVNIPYAGMAQYDKAEEPEVKYVYDPHIDPSLQWAGKAERTSFEIPTSSIHIHESIKPLKLVSSLLRKYRSTEYVNGQTTLWHEESPAERMKRRRESIEFYQHGVDWTNRMIAGDSLVIMNSLLEKEGMSGQVQMVYFDPPYGIKYGSNFQPFIDKRDVYDGKDEDLSKEPEMIKAFRDTWELGIHSYLSYLRDRLLLARELLSESGSVFVQISDENVHHVREILDEVFGKENFVSQIVIKRASVMFAKKLIDSDVFYVLWFAKNIDLLKYHQLYQSQDKQEFADSSGSHLWSENSKSGECIKISPDIRKDIKKYLSENPDLKLFGTLGLNAQGTEKQKGYTFRGVEYYPPTGTQWKTSYPEGLDKLVENNRIIVEGNKIRYKYYYDDYPITRLGNYWDSIGAAGDKIYVVQTNQTIVERCLLMSTDPGELVLDITCGSGTTAYSSEQWGRRWITCDTSRVALALAKQRLMTATFDYYKLAHPEQGIGSGFIYKTSPHVTLGSIANNDPPKTETLYDQPEIEKDKIRVSGPFTMEALPAPTVKPIDDVVYKETAGKKQEDYIDQLYASGILVKGGNRIKFSRIEPLSGTRYIHAEAETKEENPKCAVICFGSETHPVDVRFVDYAIDELKKLASIKPEILIFAGFQFDPEASKIISEMIWPGITLLQVQMNTDLMVEDLKKKESSAQSFFLIGQPDVELIKLEDGKYQVKVNGFDYYNVNTGIVESGDTSRIAMWMLDIDYDGMSIEPEQVFFPLGGKNGGWNKLAKTLKAEINPDLIEAYAGCESLPFEVKESEQIAVKIIDDRGIESIKVISIGE